MKTIAITDIAGIRIGQVEDVEGATGLTVIIAENRMAAGVDVRGGGPASRDSRTLDPLAAAEQIDAVVLAGGSAFGLDAAGGVRAHADGAIYTGPTMVTPHDLIGEAGAEYYDGTHIVPLTNRRYSQPFADVIAEGVAGRIGGGGGRTVVQNVTQNIYEREDAYVAGTIAARSLMSAAQGV